MATHDSYSIGEAVVLLGNAASFNEPAPLPARGAGYLAGEYPDGITTIEGIPVSAEVRILYRTATGELGDGVLVASTQSALDGTWRIDGLNPALLYDVVARYDGQNDVLMAAITPFV